MPDRPRSLHPLAEKILTALAGRPDAGEIVLGGYFALQHYSDFRTTYNIRAWWRTGASEAAEAAIGAAIKEVADSEGYELRERRFGQTLSFELHRDGKKRFSFQIAVRSVELEPPVPSAWPPILIETLGDNIGAKMNALVQRGAPRDFLDIMHVVNAGVITSSECWKLWQGKNPGVDVAAAKGKVLFHLSQLEQRRPLDSIGDPKERERARNTRDWFRREFLGSDA